MQAAAFSIAVLISARINAPRRRQTSIRFHGKINASANGRLKNVPRVLNRCKPLFSRVAFINDVYFKKRLSTYHFQAWLESRWPPTTAGPSGPF